MRISFNPEALAEAEEATRWYRDNGGTSPSSAFTQELHIGFPDSGIVRQSDCHRPSKPQPRILGGAAVILES